MRSGQPTLSRVSRVSRFSRFSRFRRTPAPRKSCASSPLRCRTSRRSFAALRVPSSPMQQYCSSENMVHEYDTCLWYMSMVHAVLLERDDCTRLACMPECLACVPAVRAYGALYGTRLWPMPMARICGSCLAMYYMYCTRGAHRFQ